MQNVNNTMLDDVMSILAPHYCCSCDRVGGLLCDNCKYNIISEPFSGCISCMRPTVTGNLCVDCRVPYCRAWLVGERTGALQRVIGLHKFERARSAHKVLGDLLLGVLPELPIETRVVPVPTASNHIRERGYDHMVLIARYVAKYRGLKCERIVRRKFNSSQRFSGAESRARLASQVFEVCGSVDPDVPYLVIDDVVTTGATIKYVARALRDAGAKQIWVAAIARQTLK